MKLKKIKLIDKELKQMGNMYSIWATYPNGQARSAWAFYATVFAGKFLVKKHKMPFGRKKYDPAYLCSHLHSIAKYLETQNKPLAAQYMYALCDAYGANPKCIDPKEVFRVFLATWDDISRLSSTYRVLREMMLFSTCNNKADYRVINRFLKAAYIGNDSDVA